MVRNDDTEARIAGLVVENHWQDKIAEALGNVDFFDALPIFDRRVSVWILGIYCIEIMCVV